jgi:hypothetical protein
MELASELGEIHGFQGQRIIDQSLRKVVVVTDGSPIL